MKWFEHDTSARNDVKLKILKKKFGAEGYGVYFQLLEIIGESIEVSNPDDWGFVDKVHSVETLADEVGVEPEKLRAILKLCNEIDLFQKYRERLYCHQILNRLDTYARRYAKDVDFEARKKQFQKETSNNVQTNFEEENEGGKNVENDDDDQRSDGELRTNFEQTSNNVRLHNITEHNITSHNNKQKLTSFAEKYLEHWNTVHGTKFTAIDPIVGNLKKRMKSYSFEDILKAVEVVKVHHYWKDKMKPVILLRSQNTAKEPVDYIGEMLNYKQAKGFKNEQNEKYEGI